jgi:hypothetical protein
MPKGLTVPCVGERAAQFTDLDAQVVHLILVAAV